jgi:hypothetical protein
MSMKIAVFWVVAPCSLVEVYQRFRGQKTAIFIIWLMFGEIYNLKDKQFGDLHSKGVIVMHLNREGYMRSMQ